MIEIEIVWGDQTRSLKLEDGEHTVGRAGDNAVQLPVGRVSKQHAIIRVEGDRLFIRDLGSTNGTEIDGEPVGDAEVELSPQSTVNFADAMVRRPSAAGGPRTSFLRNNQVSTAIRYNIREGYSAAARERIMDFSSELFELLASEGDAVVVEKAACKFVSRCVKADRVILLEDQGEATQIEARASWTRQKSDEGVPLQLSTTILNQVIKERDSILVANPMEDPKYLGEKSIMSLHLRSAMAVPLFDNQRVRGIMYVDTANPTITYTQEDLHVLTATANAVAVKLRNLSFEKEMRTAARIQRGLLPRSLVPPKGFELEAYQMMCRAVGGDLYQCLTRPNGKTLIALGDVAGKGIPAALAMGAATVLIGSLAEIGGELVELTHHLHRQLVQSLTDDQFITLFIGELDGTTGHIHYVNAGHEPPLIFRATGALDALDPTGMAIAMFDDLTWTSGDVTLEPGDLMAVFSDGVPEATTNGETFLGMEPVKEILAEHQNNKLPDIRKKIISTVKGFLNNEPMSDDVTMMLLRRCETCE